MLGLCQWIHFLECLSKSGFSGENAVFSELLLFWNSLTQAQLYKKDYQKSEMIVFSVHQGLCQWISILDGFSKKWLLQEKSHFSRSLLFFRFTDTDLVVRKILSNFRNDSVLHWSQWISILGRAWKNGFSSKKGTFFWLSCGFLIHWHRLKCTQIAIKIFEMIVFYIGDGVVSVKPDSWSILEKCVSWDGKVFFLSSFLFGLHWHRPSFTENTIKFSKRWWFILKLGLCQWIHFLALSWKTGFF